MKLNQKVAVITGAASGIGAATARLFFNEGARVVLADRNEASAQQLADELNPKGDQCLVVQVDVSQSSAVKSLLEKAQQRFGRIDILVNNAGFGISATAEETTDQQWAEVMQVNVNGVFYGCKHVLPIMRTQGGGVIVNTASVAGLVGLRNRVAYCTSKGAVIAMTRALALDHAQENIRVNCVAPGTVESPYFTEIMAQAEEPEQLYQQLAARQPLLRLGQPEEIAKSILYLASDDSSFSTGSVLVVDGGLSAA